MFDDDEAPRRHKTLNFAFVAAAGLTLLCIVIGQSAAQFAELASTPSALTAQSGAKPPKFNAIDYATTGAVKGKAGVISPCER